MPIIWKSKWENDLIMNSAQVWRDRGREIAQLPLEPLEVSQKRIENYLKITAKNKNRRIKQDRENADRNRRGIFIRQIQRENAKANVKKIRAWIEERELADELPPLSNATEIMAWAYLTSGIKGAKEHFTAALRKDLDLTNRIRERYLFNLIKDTKTQTKAEQKADICWDWFRNKYGEAGALKLIKQMAKECGATYVGRSFLMKKYLTEANNG